MGTVELTLLGGFTGRLASGRPVRLASRKAWALLAYLAMPAGQAHPPSKLAALLWRDASERRALDSLRHVLAALRHRLPASALVTVGGSVALNPDTAVSDVAVFQHVARQDTPEALARAAALFRGELLEGLGVGEEPFEEWLRLERERLRELARAALTTLLGHYTRAGRIDRAIEVGLRLVGLDPLQEGVYRALMRLYASAGRRGTALRQYQLYVDLLQRELGAEPEPETKRLYQSILRSRPETGRATHVGAAQTPLIGRDAELTALRRALVDACAGRGHVAIVTGEGGVGKSTLVAALAADTQERSCRLLLGRGHETEQGLAFGPWIDALRSACVGDCHGLRDRLPFASRAELVRLLPALALPELPPPALDPHRLFTSVVDLLAALAVDHPVVIVLDDLHWADESTARPAAFVARRIASLPVLLILVMRDEEPLAPALAAALSEVRRQPNTLQFTVAPLSHSETLALPSVPG